MFLRAIGVCAGMVASFSLLKAWTMRHPPVAFFTQKFGLECGEILSRTWPACRRPSKKSSMALTWSCGSGHCRVTQYFEPGARSISWRTPRSAGSSAGILSGKTSANSRAVS
ncbi:hypothetical protein PF010_g1957 [Phytophthora fragariae]|uniref:Uncharacterized protein n=1 Tax=Phytophthora fragariae TaxID=53985 RepID=A0A6A3FP62_9STRA|nr:hypothetical protein PF003_g9440 [Phytophthora fragariae]KAE8947854.1 hypothetical protein PF009_g2523 [Phytophthora fragariae]KAE9135720.1 hypothetical protein PF010_g1957 [Phytophthora fragariae]KAE9135821.1 hypothetical protein PF007_g2400 [Phytophthora fragariae]KAE9153985.1 hypothetical protein PF006_g1901 [Phytophthora fragariae]